MCQTGLLIESSAVSLLSPSVSGVIAAACVINNTAGEFQPKVFRPLRESSDFVDNRAKARWFALWKWW